MKNLSRLITMFRSFHRHDTVFIAPCNMHDLHFMAGGFAGSVILGEVEGGGDDGGGGHEDNYGCEPGAPHQAPQEGVLICVARIGLSRWRYQGITLLASL